MHRQIRNSQEFSRDLLRRWRVTSPPLRLLFLFVFFSACAKNKPTPKVGFYYWKTQFKINAKEQAALDSLHAQSLYIRIFDVDWSFNEHQAIPKGTQSNTPDFPKGINPVPTIYITNRTFLHVSNVDSLAQKILDYTDIILEDWSIKPKKLQLDADWTASTKDAYFRLIKYIKSKGSFEQISTTIRLHQYKYPKKTGVPPADEGILMCYNTGKIKDWDTENSIASPHDIAPYLKKTKPYPLSLGVALPIFSWTVIFRDSSFYKIVSDADLSWQQDTTHYQQLSRNRYIVKAGTFLKGHYLYKGDLLRYETIDPAALRTISKLLVSKQSYSEILYYHLDDDNISKYHREDLQDVIQILADTKDGVE